MTGMQVVTTSQVQIIECRWQAFFVLSITDGVRVCVAVTTLAQSSSYQKAHVELNVLVGMLIGDRSAVLLWLCGLLLCE